MATTLLQTKLYIPQPRSDLVSRSRLLERLNEALQHRLTLISAPAGFGKTTLVSEWLEQIDRPAAWLSLDKDDNDPTRFLTYLVALFQQIRAGIGQTAQSLLYSSPSPPPETLITTLINDVTADPIEFILVLDDYHLIESQPIHQTLTFLLDHQPSEMHLLITSRADPPLPLSRLRVRGQITELRENDLRFTVEEATAFLNKVIGLKLSLEEVAKLESRTEGWIAGLQLAGLSMQRQDDLTSFINAFAGDDQYIVDYLVEEVLNQQPQETQNFLLQTSILKRLCGSLCDAVLGRGAGGRRFIYGNGGENLTQAPQPPSPLAASQDVLEYLDQANLFIVSLDNKRAWYRYHHLFAELLQNRLQRTQPDLIPLLHRRASDWYESNSWMAEAVNHALSAGDYDHATGLIAQNTRSMLKRGEATTLWGWLNKLPQETVRVNPHLSLASAWARLLMGPLEAFEPALRQAEQVIANLPAEAVAGQRALLAEVQAMRVIAAVEQGDTSPAIVQLARQALDDLPDDSHYLNSALTTSLALAYHAKGDTEAAIQTFTAAKSIAEQSDNVFSCLFTSYELAELYLEHGQLGRAEALHRQALSLVEDRFGLGTRHIPLAGAAHIGLGKLLYEWNDLEAARQHLEKGLELTNQQGGLGFPREASLALAFLHQALGDEQAAVAQMQQAEEMARTAPRPQVMEQVSLHKVRLQLAQGQVTAVQRWARDRDLDVRQVPDYSTEMAYLTLVRTYMAQGDQKSLSAIINVITQLVQRAEAQQRWGGVVEILILQALAYQTMGQIERALKALEGALSLAEAEGYMRRFIDEGQPMMDLLQAALNRKIIPGYSSRLLAACKADQVPQIKSQPLVEPLTERELEVLHLIAAGLNNQAIADTLIITVGTVKRHTTNIYGKLGVNSRTQAAAKARELNLIE